MWSEGLVPRLSTTQKWKSGEKQSTLNRIFVGIVFTVNKYLHILCTMNIIKTHKLMICMPVAVQHFLCEKLLHSFVKQYPYSKSSNVYNTTQMMLDGYEME